ncbi:hypothetical protein DFH08DRAFT_1034294 [Mycena albidolilacea]|uniref:Uncharacterized protein n=1 Tax=Mycena albidolilacea TaxID=1033008 RepID=A0AAD6ZFR5_9AGAR|nr:hypothetical protein DFH08DRAFT_1034294 [Mycena albidolilacea]
MDSSLDPKRLPSSYRLQSESKYAWMPVFCAKMCVPPLALIYRQADLGAPLESGMDANSHCPRPRIHALDLSWPILQLLPTAIESSSVFLESTRAGFIPGVMSAMPSSPSRRYPPHQALQRLLASHANRGPASRVDVRAVVAGNQALVRVSGGRFWSYIRRAGVRVVDRSGRSTHTARSTNLIASGRRCLNPRPPPPSAPECPRVRWEKPSPARERCASQNLAHHPPVVLKTSAGEAKHSGFSSVFESGWCAAAAGGAGAFELVVVDLSEPDVGYYAPHCGVHARGRRALSPSGMRAVGVGVGVYSCSISGPSPRTALLPADSNVAAGELTSCVCFGLLDCVGVEWAGGRGHGHERIRARGVGCGVDVDAPGAAKTMLGCERGQTSISAASAAPLRCWARVSGI